MVKFNIITNRAAPVEVGRMAPVEVGLMAPVSRTERATKAAAHWAALQVPKKLSAEFFAARIIWKNVFWNVLLHLALPIAIYLALTGRVSLPLAVWTLAGAYMSMVGVVAGAHRLWSHRAFKARWPFELLLLVLETLAGQGSAFQWAQNHRVHHKHVETNADPHNIMRGFFFAHMGWFLCEEHPEVERKRARTDVSDLEANWLVMFQHKHYVVLNSLSNWIYVLIPVFAWNENFFVSLVLAFGVRYILSLHGIWLVNSVAHYYGDRPYDESQEARDSPLLISLGVGVGFHNYHHTFPYDYGESEFGYLFNAATAFIDLGAALGLVYDRRKATREIVQSRKSKSARNGKR